MVRAARQGKRVVRLKGGDPFVFGRGAEEALALAVAGIPFEVVPGVTAAVAAPELAGIPVTHRGVASGFLVLAGHSGDTLDRALGGVRPGGPTLVVMMGVAGRAEIAARLAAHGWPQDTPAALVCGASTAEAWTWTGRLADVAAAQPPGGVAGMLVVGEVVRVRDALAAASAPVADVADEVKYGRS
jgi:siroheme synthase